MTNWLFLLVACEPSPNWTLPAPPAPPREAIALDPERMAVVERFGAPRAMALVDDELLWSNGGALFRGGTVVDTPGWTMGFALHENELWVADGRHGLQIRDPKTLALRATPYAGDARAVDGDFGLLVEGWLVRLSTGERVAVDGVTLAGLATRGDEWAATSFDGVLWRGRGGRVEARGDLRGHDLAWWGDVLVVRSNGDRLVDVNGNILGEGVSGLAQAAPPWWSSESSVRRLGHPNVIRQRSGASVVRLDPAPSGVLVAWNDGLIEHVATSGDVLRTWKFTPSPKSPLYEQPVDSALSISPEGLRHVDWAEPVPLPDGHLVHEFFEFGPWAVGMSRLSGGVVAVHETGLQIRHLLPGMPNGAVVVDNWLIVSLSAKGAAAMNLSDPRAPASILELPSHSHQLGSWVCSDGSRTLLAWEEQGVYELAIRDGELQIVDQVETPGVAVSCRWTGEHFEVWDSSGLVVVR